MTSESTLVELSIKTLGHKML